MMSSNRRNLNIAVHGDIGLYETTRKPRYIDVNDQYLSHSSEPKDHLNNPDNLFDDSNSRDRKWVKLVKDYQATVHKVKRLADRL